MSGYELTEDAVNFLSSLEGKLAAGMSDADMIAAAKERLQVDTDEDAMRMLATLVAIGNGAGTPGEIAGFIRGIGATRAALASG